MHAEGRADLDTSRIRWSAAEELQWEHSSLLFAIGYDDISLVCHVARTIAETADKESQSLSQRQAAILRDIFANPFRRARLDPACRTETVRQLGAAIYDDHAFDRLPILADALEEAGCTNSDILNHCRQTGEHVRGCWVVDLILGKE